MTAAHSAMISTANFARASAVTSALTAPPSREFCSRTYAVPPIGAELRDLAMRASKFGQRFTHFDSLHWLVSLRVVDDADGKPSEWTLRVAHFAPRPTHFSLDEDIFWRKVTTWRNVLAVPPGAPQVWDYDIETRYAHQACAVLISWNETCGTTVPPQAPSQLALLPPTRAGVMVQGW